MEGKQRELIEFSPGADVTEIPDSLKEKDLSDFWTALSKCVELVPIEVWGLQSSTTRVATVSGRYFLYCGDVLQGAITFTLGQT
jgi:hypothetical protein